MKHLFTISKKAIFSLSLILMSTLTFAQNWTKSSDKNGVNFYYQIATCDGSTKVLLKFENTSNTNQDIEISGVIETSTGKTNIDKLKFNVAANTSVEGKCSDSAASTNFIFIGDATVTNVTLSL